MIGQGSGKAHGWQQVIEHEATNWEKRMSRESEEVRSGNGSGQRGQWQHRLETLIVIGVLLLVAWPFIMTYQPPWGQTAQRSLAYGAVMYALVIIAALLVRVVARLSLRPLKLVLASLVVALLAFPPLFGSISIAFGLFQLAGNLPERSDIVFLGLFLWLLVWIPLALFLASFIQRTTTHV